MDNKTTVIIVSLLAALLIAGGTFFYVKSSKTKKIEALEAELFSADVEVPKTEVKAQTTNNLADLKLPDILKDKKADFVDEFNDLNNWLEEEDFEFNKWAITTKGELEVKDGILLRKSAGTSGLKLKDVEIKDAAVAIRLRVNQMPESGAVGTRIHLRNPEDHWCYGLGVNITTYSYELANWHGKGEAKTAVSTPAAAQKQLDIEQSWVTVTAVIKGNKLSYYLDGQLVAEVEEDGFPEKGGLFLSVTNFIEIDKVAVFNL